MRRSADVGPLRLRWRGMTALNFRGLENALLQHLYFGTLLHDGHGPRVARRPPASGAEGECAGGRLRGVALSPPAETLHHHRAAGGLSACDGCQRKGVACDPGLHGVDWIESAKGVRRHHYQERL